jgi:SsrA-binding protein
MHKREILRLKKSIEAKGLTLIPLSMYFSLKNKVKVELGLCRGKNTVDKREDIKKRLDELDIKRAMKR